ncbi:Phosphotransferase enzyme family protein [Lentzea aerocolonigenes]|nr:Phosphotransferase enzyme family protein [Lentzea aerocolonigenes]
MNAVRDAVVASTYVSVGALFGVELVGWEPLSLGVTGRAYKVTDGHDDYVLKEVADEPGVSFELAWLRDLTGNPDVRTPVPLERADGGLMPVSRGGRKWTLSRWVPGRASALETEQLLTAYARVLTALQRTELSKSTTRVMGSARRYDSTYFDNAAGIVTHAVGDVLGGGEFGSLWRAMMRAEEVLESLDKIPGEIGPVHADVHEDHLMFDEAAGSVGVVDFARCGVGVRGLDVAMVAHYLPDELHDELRLQYTTHGGSAAGLDGDEWPSLLLLAAVDNLATLTTKSPTREMLLSGVPDLLHCVHNALN